MEVPNKKRYYSIGELAEAFHVNTSKIRFWEKEFDFLSPSKSMAGNRRYTQYRKLSPSISLGRGRGLYP